MRRCNSKLLIFSLLSIFVLAPVLAEPSNNGYLMFELGGFNANQGISNHIGIVGAIGDDFTVTKANNQNVLFGLGYYRDAYIQPHYTMQYGVNAFYLPQTAVEGNVIQEGLYTNLTYRYYITNFPVYLDGKILLPIENTKLDVTVDIGIGPNIMYIDKFTEASIEGLPDQIFGSNTKVTFSATLGVSIKFKNVYKTIPIEVGYRFFYLGSGSLSTTNSQATNSLNTGDNYAYAFIVSTNLNL